MNDTKLRAATALLGAWVMGSLCFSLVATENFYTIDRLLAASPNATFHTLVAKLGHAESRELLRYLSAELNRVYFFMWNIAQLALGLATLWLLAGQPIPAKARWTVAGMSAIVVVMIGALTPAITSLGRSLDFVPRDPAPLGMTRFWILHGTYTLLQFVVLAGGIAALMWISRTVDSRQSTVDSPQSTVDS